MKNPDVQITHLLTGLRQICPDLNGVPRWHEALLVVVARGHQTVSRPEKESDGFLFFLIFRFFKNPYSVLCSFPAG